MTAPATAKPRWASPGRLVSTLAATVVVGGTIFVPADPLRDIAVQAPDRVTAARFTVTPRYQRCTEFLQTGSTIPSTRCAPRLSPAYLSFLQLSRLAGARIRATADPVALHTTAMMDLLWADSAGKRVRAAISSLERASRLIPNSAAVLADLSGAYLAQAERTQDPRDLLEALAAAEAALESDGRNLTARFNLALSLERLWLDDQATTAWREYLAIDSRSEWAAEARERIAAMARAHVVPRPEATSGTGEIMRYAERRALQAAQLLGWDELLAQWGEAVEQGNVQQADDRLKLAAALGDLLVRRGGDASLADQVRLIRGHSRNRAETRRLARAHQAYARARRAFRNADYQAADTLFGTVIPITVRGTPLHQWATVFHSSTQAYGSLARGEALVREMLPRIDSVRHPALAGRARWILGTILLRSTRPASAVDEYDRAARLFERAGEPEHLGIVQVFSGVAKHQMGDPRAAYTRLHRGLGYLHAYRASPWLHTALYQQAEIVAGEGRLRAEERILKEDAAAAGRTAIALYLAESLTLRARLLGSTGRGGWTHRDLIAAQQAVGRMPRGKAKRWFTNELREARAAVPGSTPSTHTVALLDSAVREWRELAVPVRMIAPLLARADAQLALGSVSAAEHDLLRALELLDQQRGDIAQPVDRAVFLDARAGVFDRLVMLRIRAGRSDEALAFLERGRSSYTTERGTLWVRPGQTTGPAGQTVLNYALIGDTLLIWTIRGPTTSLTRRIVRRDLLVRRIEQVRTLLELGSDEDAARPALRALHAILVAPVEDDLGRANAPLVVVADGEIAGVPFAALWDPDARQYLVESHVIRFSPTLADAGRRSYPGAGAPARVLVVADPAFNRDAYPDLDRLAGALTEGRALVRQYPGASLLQGEAATPPALLAALPGAEMVHYGGHALFNDERPDQSQLVLAPVRGAPGPASLTADEISRLRLTRLRLVMLAACETLRSRSGRSGGFTGLSSAFLAAGAQGVVGSLWRVDDRATGELAARFYEAYPGTGDGAAALASAQRQMRRSHDPALRSPAAWAAFRYAGN